MNLWGRTVLARLIVSKFYRLNTRFTQPLINKLHQTSPLNQNFLFCKPPDFTQTMQRSLSRGKIAMRGGYFTGVPQVNITNTNNCEQVMALHIPGFSKIMSMCIISHQINNVLSTNPSCLFSLKWLNITTLCQDLVAPFSWNLLKIGRKFPANTLTIGLSGQSCHYVTWDKESFVKYYIINF